MPCGTVLCCTTGGRRRGAALRLEARCHARAAEVLAVPPVLQPRRHCSAEVGNGTTDGPTFGNADSRCTRPAARSPRDTHRAQLPSGLSGSQRTLAQAADRPRCHECCHECMRLLHRVVPPRCHALQRVVPVLQRVVPVLQRAAPCCTDAALASVLSAACALLHSANTRRCDAPR